MVAQRPSQTYSNSKSFLKGARVFGIPLLPLKLSPPPRELLSIFDQAQEVDVKGSSADWATMKKCADTLRFLNGGTSVIQHFVCSRPCFFDVTTFERDDELIKSANSMEVSTSQPACAPWRLTRVNVTFAGSSGYCKPCIHRDVRSNCRERSRESCQAAAHVLLFALSLATHAGTASCR